MDLKKEIKNNIGIIKICGDTSINTEKKLFEVLRGLVQKTNYKIILDLKECTYIDSGAIGSIILTNKFIADNGGKFCVCGVRLDEIDKLFNATKLNQLIPKFNDVDEAFIKFF